MVNTDTLALGFSGDMVEIDDNVPAVSTTGAVVRLPQVVLPVGWGEKERERMGIEGGTNILGNVR